MPSLPVALSAPGLRPGMCGGRRRERWAPACGYRVTQKLWGGPPVPRGSPWTRFSPSRSTSSQEADAGVVPGGDPRTRGSAPHLLHLHQEEGEVVVLGGVLDPVFQLRGDADGHFFHWESGYLAEEGFQTVFPELFVCRIQRLRDAIAEYDQHIARVQCQRAFLITCLWEHADDGAACSKFFHRRIPAGAQKVGRIVAGIDIM